eukprot:gene8825-1581_t
MVADSNNKSPPLRLLQLPQWWQVMVNANCSDAPVLKMVDSNLEQELKQRKEDTDDDDDGEEDTDDDDEEEEDEDEYDFGGRGANRDLCDLRSDRYDRDLTWVRPSTCATRLRLPPTVRQATRDCATPPVPPLGGRDLGAAKYLAKRKICFVDGSQPPYPDTAMDAAGRPPLYMPPNTIPSPPTLYRWANGGRTAREASRGREPSEGVVGVVVGPGLAASRGA